jgi:AraC family transcriptional regulator of adaptative response/methylated-DNA-[protein]-cysteine methyltransferase
MNAVMKTREPTGAATLRDPRWVAITKRDSSEDGRFFYSVKTTGVYCRPSCGSRLPRPQNVQFHATQADAERAGFRACKRCKPNDVLTSEKLAATVVETCRFIESAEGVPSLETLARRAKMSPFYFHRVFKRITGLTPKQYAAAHRSGRVRKQLGDGGRVTDAIFDAGYQSSSRFYEKSGEILGMKPTDFRAGGRNAQIRFAIGESSLGSILVAQSARGICAISIGDDPEAMVRDLQDRFPQAQLIGADREFEKLVAQVVGFVEAPRIGLDLPLDVRGTAFQQRVWRALRKIPAGKTVSYTDIARRIGAPKAVRAVAQACGANPVAVAIPCHRVVRNDGALSGYRWGIERKRALLDKEATA